MGYTTSTIHGIEVPDSSETNNIPEDIGKVVTALEAGSLAKRLTGAQISALTVPQKPAGLVVYDTTRNAPRISDGTNFADILTFPTYALGLRSGSAQTIPDATATTLTYTSDDDPGSILNAGTGVLTIPTAGLWQVSAWVKLDTDTSTFVDFYLRDIAAGTVLASQRANFTSLFGTSLSAIWMATASQTLDLRLYADGPGSQPVSNVRFAAVQLGRS